MTGISPLGELRLFLSLYRLCRSRKPDLIHLFTIKPVIFGTLAAAAARVPVRIATITGLGYVFTSGGPLLRAIVKALYRFSLRFADIVYFLNPDDRDDFLKHALVHPSKVRMIAGDGVDTVAFAPKYRARSGQLLFVMIARLLREKGVREFLEAAKIVKANEPDARFVLAGGCDENNPTSFSEDEVKTATDECGVTWADYVDDVRPLLDEADVVVLPSYREGTPMTLLEAAAMAKPIIATDVPGCVEVVKHETNGLLVKRADSRSLAEAMLRCIREPSRLVGMGKAGRRLVEEKFDARRITAQILEDYRMLWRRKAVNQ
jgi:glycosyltransferase involved in cell wall biosynthesis